MLHAAGETSPGGREHRVAGAVPVERFERRTHEGRPGRDPRHRRSGRPGADPREISTVARPGVMQAVRAGDDVLLGYRSPRNAPI